MKGISSKKNLPLLLILGAAVFVRLIGLWGQELLGDEAAYAFRGYGYIDYLDTSAQTQPIEWFKDTTLPRWTYLSFHDAPPLGFAIWHVFTSIFGSEPASVRLPGVLGGIGSIILTYALVRKIYKDITHGLSAAVVFAISGAMIWISRSVLLESLQLFFVLLSVYAFFTYIENKKRWWMWGGATAAALLVKYTSIFLIPVYVSYLLVTHREILKNIKTWLAFAQIAIMFSPVIIYNTYLYKTVGHFDLQISYALHQNTPEWQGLIGKAQYPAREIAKNAWDLFGVEIVALMGISTVVFWGSVRKKRPKKETIFWFLYGISLAAMYSVIGSAPRFLALLGPLMAVSVGAAIALVIKRIIEIDWKSWIKYIEVVIIAGFFVIEGIWALRVNNIEKNDAGIVALDEYLNEEIKSSSLAVSSIENKHLDAIAKAHAGNSKNAKSVIIIYNDNVAAPTRLWVFERRLLYGGIPVFFVEGFEKVARENMSQLKGLTAYFIQSTEHTALNPFKKEKKNGELFEQELTKQGLEPIKIIYSRNSKEMFRIYRFNIEA